MSKKQEYTKFDHNNSQNKTKQDHSSKKIILNEPYVISAPFLFAKCYSFLNVYI